MKSILITSNIDGLHTDEFLKSKILTKVQFEAGIEGLDLFYPNVFEIQGNARYMRCATNNCETSYFPSPTVEECIER